jgi:hypothetical protein
MTMGLREMKRLARSLTRAQMLKLDDWLHTLIQFLL